MPRKDRCGALVAKLLINPERNEERYVLSDIGDAHPAQRPNPSHEIARPYLGLDLPNVGRW